MSDINAIFKDRKEFVKFCKPYEPEAYSFLMAALDYCQKKLPQKRHITGKELLEGIREYGLNEYGPMTKEVFEHWGVKSTGDFGAIVFKLISVGVLSKSDSDSIDDFKDVYDFSEAFNTGLPA